jgi:hypothetical protein
MLRPALLFAALLLFHDDARAQLGRRWKDAEIAPLGKSLAAYLEARASALGVDKAKSDLAKNLEDLRRSSDGLDPLRQPLDLQRALVLSHDLTRIQVNKSKVSSEVYSDSNLDGAGLNYAYLVPKDYDPAQKTYPLILAIPDEGETPAEHIRGRWEAREIQEGAIMVAVSMPKNQGEWARVSVNGRPGGLSYVLTGLRMACERFAVDFDRIYVVGRGKGVPAAIAAGNYSPQRFAGILGRAGDAGEIGPENFGNLPTWFAGAGARASAFEEASRAAGHANCTLVPTGTEQELWAWIQQHPRKANPESVTVVPGDPFPTRAYWVAVAPSATYARASATLDRDKRTIQIQAEGVSQVTLYLNDALIGLDQPLHVVCNGVERTVLPTRQLPTTLDLLLDGTSDAGCMYVAQAIVPTSADAPTAAAASEPAKDPEFEKGLSEADGQVDKLWQLYLWCKSTQRDAKGTLLLQHVLRLAPDNTDAHTALGHKLSKGLWFTTKAASDRFLRSQDPVEAAKKGHIEFKSLWMHPEERALVGKGWVKEQETGLWITPADKKRLTEGWARQDTEWIAPSETARLDEGLWKVDGEWVDLKTANERHARIDSMWKIPSADVLLYSTTDRDTCMKALAQMSRAINDLRKVFGGEPVLPLRVAMLHDEEQYDRFAFGDPDGRRRATHAGRLQVVHSAFFAESWFPRVEGKFEFSGMGACYWDPLVPNGDSFGLHSARLAVGFSYVEALDPSPKAVRQALTNGPQAGYYAAYQAEKMLPAWLRWGGAVYAERFFNDELVAADGDAWWARKWSLENLTRMGGMQSLADILAFKLDPENRDASLRMLIQAGLVVSFIVDGNCAPVNAAHAEFKAGIAMGKVRPGDVKALTDALVAHEKELRAYAGM